MGIVLMVDRNTRIYLMVLYAIEEALQVNRPFSWRTYY